MKNNQQTINKEAVTAYWKANISLMQKRLAIWAFVFSGCGCGCGYGCSYDCGIVLHPKA